MTETAPPLDYALYPHLVERIVSYADASCLPALRATCQTFRRSAERRMYSHIAVRVLREDSDVPNKASSVWPFHGLEHKFTVELFAPSTSTPASRRVPGLRWTEPAIANLEPYLNIIDFEDGREDWLGRWKGDPSEGVLSFNLAQRARVIRRWHYKSLMHVGTPFFNWSRTSNGVPGSQVAIMFVDYTVTPAVQELVSGPRGAGELCPQVNHMPDATVHPSFGEGGTAALGIVNVRYDPRQPDLRDGVLSLGLGGAQECKEVVVIFTPTELWSGPPIPKPERVDADRSMGWLHSMIYAIRMAFEWKAYELAGESSRRPNWGARFVFVGAERLDAAWVDSPAWHFDNPVTNDDLAAGMAKTAQDDWLDRGSMWPAIRWLSRDQLARCVSETLDKRGGWDGLFRFITLDEWKAEVDPELFDLATIPPAKPLCSPVHPDETVGHHSYKPDFSPEEFAAAIAKHYGTAEPGNDGP